MLIKTIFLSADDYGPTKGRLTGHITFAGQYGEVKLALQQRHVEKITGLLADAIVDAAKDTATLMTKDVIEQGAIRPALANAESA